MMGHVGFVAPLARQKVQAMHRRMYRLIMRGKARQTCNYIQESQKIQRRCEATRSMEKESRDQSALFLETATFLDGGNKINASFR